MLAEIFTAGGYHAGRDLIPASSSNAHGFFEDIRVNRRNDELVTTLELARPGRRLRRNLWWMEAFDGPVRCGDVTPERGLVPPAPFVMKDPRFVYTGPAWAAAWGSPLVVVTVRPVGEVTRSLAAMAARQPDFFRSIPTSGAGLARHAEAMWRSMYRSVLAWVDDDALFVTQTSVRTGDAVAGLGRIAGTVLTASTVDHALHHHAGHHHAGTGERGPDRAADGRDVRADGYPDRELQEVTDRVMDRVRRDAERLRRAAREPEGAITGTHATSTARATKRGFPDQGRDT